MVQVETIIQHTNSGMIYQPDDVYWAPVNEAEKMAARGLVKTTDPSLRRAAKPVAEGKPLPWMPDPRAMRVDQ